MHTLAAMEAAKSGSGCAIRFKKLELPVAGKGASNAGSFSLSRNSLLMEHPSDWRAITAGNSPADKEDAVAGGAHEEQHRERKPKADAGCR